MQVKRHRDAGTTQMAEPEKEAERTEDDLVLQGSQQNCQHHHPTEPINQWCSPQVSSAKLSDRHPSTVIYAHSSKDVEQPSRAFRAG